MVFVFLKPRIGKYLGNELEKTFLHVNINKRMFSIGHYLWKLEKITQEECCIFKLLHEVWGHKCMGLYIFIRGLDASHIFTWVHPKVFHSPAVRQKSMIIVPFAAAWRARPSVAAAWFMLLVPLLLYALQSWINHCTLSHNITVTYQLSEAMAFQLLLSCFLNQRVFYCFMSSRQLFQLWFQLSAITKHSTVCNQRLS